ncbi:MAG: hypothetical protein AAGB26_14875 [Planctomycetota bacterium]
MAGQPRPLDLNSQQAGNGMQWQLPRRPWGAGWFMPYIFIAAGIAVTAIFGINGPVTLPKFSKDMITATFDLVWLIGEVFATLGGFIVMLVGLALRYAQTTVTLTHNQLTTTDCFGPLGWTRRIDTTRITGFEINVGTSSTNGGPQVPMENVTMLIARTDLPMRSSGKQSPKNKKRDFIIAWGYPKTWMQQLADALTAGSEIINPQLSGLETTTTIGSPDDVGDDCERPVDPPEKTNIILQRENDGLTITIPPDGFIRGCKGLGCFAVMWNGFILLMLGLVVYAMLTPNNPNTSGPDSPWVLLFFLPFIAIGIGLTVFCIHSSKSHEGLVVIGQGPDAVVAYYRHSPIRKPRDLNWPVSELSHIRVDDSNMTINDEPVRELKIYPKQGKPIELLIQLNDHELDWIAYEIRRQSGLPRSAVVESD